MVSSDWVRPLSGLGDIPIERDAVGAMSLSAPAPRFKAYVYRGIGTDLYEMAAQTRDWRKYIEPPKPPPLTPRQQRAQEIAREIRREQLIEEENQRAAERAAREARRLLAVADYEERRAARYPNEPAPKKREKPKKPKKHKRVKHSTPRPAPGWKPTTGADLDDMLAELEV